MGKLDRIIDIATSIETRNNWRMATEELVQRGESMAKMIAYAAAKQAYDMLLNEIPGGSDYAEIRKSLKLVEVGGTKKGQQAAYSIHIPSRGRNIKKMDADKTIIIVTAKKGMKRASPDVALLEKNGPWTVDTIPFWPTRSEAVVSQRIVSAREIDSVSKQRKSNLPKIIFQLKEMGRNIKPYKPGDSGRVKGNAKAVPDVAMQMLSLEFSNSGKSKPVFRKVIKSTIGSMPGLSKRFSQITDAMTNPNSTEYKNWPKRMNKISSGQAGKYVGFQKRLGF
jgi:hypothetical protein